MTDITPIFVIVLIAILAVVSFVLTASRSETIIDRWANANGVTILSREQRFLRTGPFFFRHSKGQSVYRVTVRDAQGQVRRGYVRCGRWFVGLFSDAAAVEWER